MENVILETSVIPQIDKLGVNFSGGTDSSLLLYMLGITHPNTKLYVYTGSREDDGMYNIPYARNILKFLKLPNLEKHIVATWKDRADGRSKRGQFRADMCNLYGFNTWANGFTLNPSDDLGPGRDERRDTIQSVIMTNNNLEFKTYRPFVELDKRAIAKKYDELNLRDTLLPLTISCEAMAPPRPCGECYNCREKLWGFGEL